MNDVESFAAQQHAAVFSQFLTFFANQFMLTEVRSLSTVLTGI